MVAGAKKIILSFFLICLFPALSFAAPVQFLLSGFTDNSGNPCSGCKVYTYDAGTTTPKTLYTDVGLATPSANPVVLDSNGRAQVYSSGSYKFVMKTSADVTLYTFDNLNFGITVGTSDIQDDSVTLVKIKSTDRDGNARADLATVNVVQDSGVTWLGTVGGTADALTASASPAITAYTAGQNFRFKALSNNTTTTPTININSLGAKTLLRPDGFACAASDIVASQTYEITYDGTNFILQNVRPSSLSFTPTVNASTGSLSSTTYTCSYQKYLGKRIDYDCSLAFTLSGGAGAGVETITFTLPETAAGSAQPCLVYETGSPPKSASPICAQVSTTQATLYHDTGITNAAHVMKIKGSYIAAN